MKDRIATYLTKRAALKPWTLSSGSLDGVEQAVVIPALAERANLIHTLESLAANPASELARTLVVVIVNNRAPGVADPAQIGDNQATLALLDSLMHGRATGETEAIIRSGLRLAYIDASSSGRELPAKGGVGLARKIGLDRALRVLHENGASEGLLLSTDADTLVEPSYLQAVRNHFRDPQAWAAIVPYAHRLDGSPEECAAIIAYEIYLRYHALGLGHAGSPYAFPTIGSTIVCSARAYATSGGMNRRQAGEDFYFLQQLAKTGRVGDVTGTTIHPAGRSSDRVPFGTGRWVKQRLAGEQDLVLYHPEVYRVLGKWLAAILGHLAEGPAAILDHAQAIAPPLRSFLEQQGFATVWVRLQENARDDNALLDQFHRWFDGFKTLKLIHHLRDHGLPNRQTFTAVALLLGMMGASVPGLDWDGITEDVSRQHRVLDYLRKRRPAKSTHSTPTS